MAFHATCDVCTKPIRTLKGAVPLSAPLAIRGRVELVCRGCSRRIELQVTKLSHYYHNELTKDMREFLLDIAAET